jgi:hypothetical protein
VSRCRVCCRAKYDHHSSITTIAASVTTTAKARAISSTTAGISLPSPLSLSPPSTWSARWWDYWQSLISLRLHTAGSLGRGSEARNCSPDGGSGGTMIVAAAKNSNANSTNTTTSTVLLSVSLTTSVALTCITRLLLPLRMHFFSSQYSPAHPTINNKSNYYNEYCSYCDYHYSATLLNTYTTTNTTFTPPIGTCANQGCPAHAAAGSQVTLGVLLPFSMCRRVVCDRACVCTLLPSQW